MKHAFDGLCIALNPAIDRTLSIPNFAAGRVNRVIAEDVRPGGKGVNVARALADEGFRVALAGFFGSENLGPFQSLCAERGILPVLIPVGGETRTGLKIVDPETRGTTDINFAGPRIEPGDLERFAGAISDLPAKWAVLAGSLPPGVSDRFYAELIESLHERRIAVALDSSGRPLRHALESCPDIIKPNIHELEELAGRELGSLDSIAHVARDIVSSGIGLAAVSMGERGALFASPDSLVLATPPAIAPRTTVGAGDAMVAGLITARLRGLELPDAARLATAFSLKAIAQSPPTSRIISRIRIEEIR